MSDVEVMAAIIEANSFAFFRNTTYVEGSYRVSSESAKKAATALYDAGFRMAIDDTDTTQNVALRSLEERVSRLEGWTGQPSWSAPGGGV